MKKMSFHAPVFCNVLRALCLLVAVFLAVSVTAHAATTATGERDKAQTARKTEAVKPAQTGQRAATPARDKKDEGKSASSRKAAQKGQAAGQAAGPRTGKTGKAAKSARAGATVYDGEPPVTAKELDDFLTVLPRFRTWAKEHDEGAHPLVNNDKADFFYSPVASKWVQDQGWQPKRFFCVMGRMAAAMVIVEEGNDMSGTRPKDMPEVTQEELDLARKNLGLLLRAGGDAPPPINASKFPSGKIPEPQQFAAPRYVKRAKP